MLSSKRALSLLIIAVIAFQLAGASSDRAWPFMNYPMYSHSRKAGPVRTKNFVFTAITASGKEIPAGLELTGLNYFALKSIYWNTIRQGDVDKLNNLLDIVNSKREDPVVCFCAEVTEVVIDGSKLTESKETRYYRRR